MIYHRQILKTYNNFGIIGTLFSRIQPSK